MSKNLPAIIPPTHAIPQQFSREAQASFLDALSDWGNVRAAARAAEVSRTTAYRMRRACPRFRALWDAALLLARPKVEEELADRALNGVEETVFYHGEEVATRRRYDARLLLAHLGRLDRLTEDSEACEGARDFYGAVEALTQEPEIQFSRTPGELAAEEREEQRAAAAEREAGFLRQDSVPGVSGEAGMR